MKLIEKNIYNYLGLNI